MMRTRFAKATRHQTFDTQRIARLLVGVEGLEPPTLSL